MTTTKTKPPAVVDPARVAAANAALAVFQPGVRLEFVGRRAFVCWTSSYSGPQRKMWATRGQDFYPVWHRRRGDWGGTASRAMSQLVRWCQGKPVLPLGCFEHWCGPDIMLAGDRGPELVGILRAAGYPPSVACVCCGLPPVGGLDWWSHGGTSGPCCGRGPVCVHRPDEAVRLRAEADTRAAGPAPGA